MSLQTHKILVHMLHKKHMMHNQAYMIIYIYIYIYIYVCV